MAFITSRPEGTKEPEQILPVETKDKSYTALVIIAVQNVFADLFSGMTRHTYFVYETDGGTGEAIHIHGLDKTAQAHRLNLKEIALATAAKI